MGILAVLLVLPCLLAFFTTTGLFMRAVMSLAGGILGAMRMHAGRLALLRRGWLWQSLPRFVLKNVLQVQSASPGPERSVAGRPWWQEISEQDYAAFAGSWNVLVDELRTGDHLSDA